MPQNKPIQVEQFTKRYSDGLPRYNNLIIYFRETALGKIFREQPNFIKFQKEHSPLERKLHEAIRVMDPSNLYRMSEELRPFDKDIYKFYLVMKSYGTPDENLIGRG